MLALFSAEDSHLVLFRPLCYNPVNFLFFFLPFLKPTSQYRGAHSLTYTAKDDEGFNILEDTWKAFKSKKTKTTQKCVVFVEHISTAYKQKQQGCKKN